MRYFSMKEEVLFIENLRKLRKEKGLTQEKLAEKADINEKYFGKIERGESSPTFNKIIKICNALEIELYEFMKFIK